MIPEAQRPVRLASLATALPPHRLDQADARAAARELYAGRVADFDRLASVFDTAGVNTRWLARPLDWYRAPHGWAEKSAVFVEVALDLLEAAIGRALSIAGADAADVDAVVMLSSSGIATPSLEARLAGRCGLRPDVTRLPVFGLGCAGGVLGLARGADIARARPGACIVVATVELCSLILRLDDTGKTSLVANALFGDGAAAAVLTTDPAMPGPIIAADGEHLFADSLGVMGWRVDDAGLGVILARSVPDIVRHDLAPIADAFLARNGRARTQVAALAAHPGGAKVLSALGDAFGPVPGLELSRAVLSDAGNMSAPTVLFVLERLLARGIDGPVLATALGPGFTAGFLLLDPSEAGS